MALVVAAGCSDSDPLTEETAGETFVQERLERLHPERASYEIAVLCRETTGRRLSCGSSVTDPGSETALRQRWTVDLSRAGRVTGARATPRRERPRSGREWLLPIQDRKVQLDLGADPVALHVTD